LESTTTASPLVLASAPVGELVVSPLEQLEAGHRELIEGLVAYQEMYEIPKKSDIDAVANIRLNEENVPKDVPSAVFQHMVNMTVLVTHLVVEFAKKLPGFLDLEKDDQIVLLKGSASEVMILRTARRYNPAVDKVIFADGTPVTRESLCLGGLLQDYVNDMFEFARRMSILAVDNAEYALLTAICIFSDRPDLNNVAQVDVCRNRVIDALIAYERLRRASNVNFLAKLLLKLVDLRTLSSSHAEALHVLKVERGSLPQLLSEYFDVFD
jgi:ecdysone receptor